MNDLRNNLEKHMVELCLRCGSRHCGSPGEHRAADYIESVFRSYGLETRRESYPVIGWEFSSMEFYNMTERRQVPYATPCYFSNSVEVEGTLVWLRKDDLDRLDDLDLKGRICFVEVFDGVSNVMGRNHLAELLDAKGAAAGIFISDYHTALAPSTKIQRSPFLKQMGAVAVADEGAFDLARHKNDTYRICIRAHKFETESSNIIATVGKGPKCVFGGHFDTAPLIQGAGDNASGTAMVLELARLLKDNGHALQLEFAAFSGEEYIAEVLCPGSGDYVKRHGNEDIQWYMNFDDFGLLLGNMEVHTGYDEKLPPFHGVKLPVMRNYPLSSDDNAFHFIGVPNISFYDRPPFFRLHTVMDTLDIIDYDKMALGVTEALDIFQQLAAGR